MRKTVTEKAISKPKIFFCSELSRIFDLIAEKERKNSEFEKDRLKSETATDLFWYRGEANAMYNLLPSLYRRVLDIKKSDNEDEWEVLQKREKKSFSEFKTRAYHLVPNMGAYNYYLIISLMQHHGVNTRALDFSESLFSALFFALEKYIKDPNCKSDSLPCIWLFEPGPFFDAMKGEMKDECPNKIQYLDQMGGKHKGHDDNIPVNNCFQLTKAPYIADRIRVQQGCFVLFPNVSYKGHPSIGIKDSALNLLPKSNSFLTRIILTQPRKIAKEVVRIGLKKSINYPELMSICEEVNIFTFPEL